MAKAQKFEIALTILEQLGNNKFTTMTGARALAAHKDGLSFKLPTKAHYTKDGINYVRVRLTSLDLYDVEYGQIWGHQYTKKEESSGLYADQLKTDFRTKTGLDTHL